MAVTVNVTPCSLLYVNRPTFQQARSQRGASSCTARSRNLQNIRHKRVDQPGNKSATP